MVQVNVSLPDFSAGEISPKVYGRHDIAAFYNGGRRVENFITEITGMARFRTGTSYSAATQGNEAARLHSFTISDSLSFILEFTDTKLRFYQSSGRVQETAQAITGATAANPVVITYSGADNYSNGDPVFITGVSGMTELNGNEYVVANVNTGANTFELSGVDGSAFTAYTSGGTVSVVYEITTPYALADLFELKFSPVINGIMYITHPDYNPQKLTFTSITSWAIANHSPTGLTLSADNYPTAVGVYEQRLIYAGSNNNPNTLYFSKSADFDNFTVGTGVTDGISYTSATDIGRIRWMQGTSSFLAVGGFADVLQVTGGIDDVITPDSISIRPTNSFGVQDIMPIGKGTQIMYMQSNKLTLRSFEYDLQSDAYKPLDRNTIADHITSSGIKQIAYEEGRPNIVWCVKTNGVLIGMTIEDSESVSGWHRHTTDGEVVSVATVSRVANYDQTWFCIKRTIGGVDKYYIEYFNDVVTFPRREDYVSGTKSSDDELWRNISSEFQKEYIHVDSAVSYFGNASSVTSTATLTPAAATGSDIEFTASTAIFTSDMVGREVWKRSATGVETGRGVITAFTSTTVVECNIIEDFDSTDAIAVGQWYLTAGTLSGLSHLEGKTVSVVADGGQHPTKTISNGQITLDRQASVVHIGLPFIGYLESNDLEGGGTTGVAQTKRKNVSAVGFRFLDTLYAKYGTSYYTLNTIEMRNASMKMDRPPEMFTGDTKERYANDSADSRDAGWSRSKRVVVSQDQPFPCNLQLLIPYLSVSN